MPRVGDVVGALVGDKVLTRSNDTEFVSVAPTLLVASNVKEYDPMPGNIVRVLGDVESSMPATGPLVWDHV